MQGIGRSLQDVESYWSLRLQYPTHDIPRNIHQDGHRYHQWHHSRPGLQHRTLRTSIGSSDVKSTPPFIDNSRSNSVCSSGNLLNDSNPSNKVPDPTDSPGDN